RPPRESVPPEQLPDRRASTADDPRQPARAEVRLAASAQDRLLLDRLQPPRLTKRPARAVEECCQLSVALPPAMPPAVRCRRRDTETGRRLSQRHPLLDRQH